jgi:hypothetical protein
METASKTQGKRKLDLLSAVESIVDLAKDSQLSPEFYCKAGRYIKHLSDSLSLTKEQSVMLALFIDQSDDPRIEASDIAKYTGCRTTRIIRYMNDIDELVRRGLIARRRSSSSISYRVPIDVVEAFKVNKPFTPKDYSGLTCHELFDEFADIVDRVEDDEMDITIAVEHFKMLFHCNQQLLFVQKVQNLIPEVCDNEFVLLVMFCHLFVNNNDDCIGFHNIDCMYCKKDMRTIKSELEQGINILQRLGLIEYNNINGMGDKEYYRLTMKAKRDLLDELQLPSLEGKRELRNMINASDIKPRALFYSDEITHRIDDLAHLLEEKNYNDIHARLQEQGFRCGFTCLFYGAPGTGKTETVMQLARRTGRDIMQVDISEMKSMWVGESEKNVKALFDTYRQRVKESDLVPILLFNEADAIIGKRQEGAERAVDKMENSLQNIILQEMETLDGILIATTNLAQNMDNAFERRFLYKIRFDKPTVEARTAIWHELLPDLSDTDATLLAERYDFSGGQIENIARHYAIDAILHGNAVPTASNLMPHCDSERINNTSSKKIGFTR